MYDIIFVIASIVMYAVFGLPGAACAAIAGGTICFNTTWWAIALTEVFIIELTLVFDSIERGA